MSTQTVSVQEAEKRLAELIGLAQLGNDIIIAQDNRTRVRLVPLAITPTKRLFGQHRGKARLSEDFDAPLPEAFWLGQAK